MVETSDGLVETGGGLSPETPGGPILGVDSPQTHQTPAQWDEREEERTEV